MERVFVNKDKYTLKEILKYINEKQKSLITVKEFGEFVGVNIDINDKDLKNVYRRACKVYSLRYSEEDLNNSLFLYEGLAFALNNLGYNIPIFALDKYK